MLLISRGVYTASLKEITTFLRLDKSSGISMIFSLPRTPCKCWKSCYGEMCKWYFDSFISTKGFPVLLSVYKSASLHWHVARCSCEVDETKLNIFTHAIYLKCQHPAHAVTGTGHVFTNSWVMSSKWCTYKCNSGKPCGQNNISLLRWRHNERDSVSNHQPHGCLLNGLLRRRSKKTSKLRVTGLYVGNSPGPVNSPHKGPVTRKMFPFDDVIMSQERAGQCIQKHTTNGAWCHSAWIHFLTNSTFVYIFTGRDVLNIN